MVKKDVLDLCVPENACAILHAPRLVAFMRRGTAGIESVLRKRNENAYTACSGHSASLACQKFEEIKGRFPILTVISACFTRSLGGE